MSVPSQTGDFQVPAVHFWRVYWTPRVPSPQKQTVTVGGRALDQVIIDQKMQKQLCQVENSDGMFFCYKKHLRHGGKLTMNYLPVLEGSKKANIY